MFATTIRFTIPEDTDWESLRQDLVRGAFDVFRHVPGLRSIAFVYGPDRGEFGCNCAWETQDHAEALLRSDLWHDLTAEYGVARVERSEVCAYVEDGDLYYPGDYGWRRVSEDTIPPPLA